MNRDKLRDVLLMHRLHIHYKTCKISFDYVCNSTFWLFLGSLALIMLLVKTEAPGQPGSLHVFFRAFYDETGRKIWTAETFGTVWQAALLSSLKSRYVWLVFLVGSHVVGWFLSAVTKLSGFFSLICVCSLRFVQFEDFLLFFGLTLYKNWSYS